MPAACDNACVGVRIRRPGRPDEELVIWRATDPPGVAPVAGHLDDHGSPETAARNEVEEESGLHVVRLTQVDGGWLDNQCRRAPGPRGIGHHWSIFEADVEGDLKPSPREVGKAAWVRQQDLQGLVLRTAAYAHGRLTDADFRADPGLEPVWAWWLTRLNAIELAEPDLHAIMRVCCGQG